MKEQEDRIKKKKTQFDRKQARLIKKQKTQFNNKQAMLIKKKKTQFDIKQAKIIKQKKRQFDIQEAKIVEKTSEVSIVNEDQNNNVNIQITTNQQTTQSKQSGPIEMSQVDKKNNQQIQRDYAIDQKLEPIQKDYSPQNIVNPTQNDPNNIEFLANNLDFQNIQPKVIKSNDSQISENNISQVFNDQQDHIEYEIPPQQIVLPYLDHCDCFLLEDHNNSPNKYFVLSKFTIYHGQFNIQTIQKEGHGRILIRQFDNDFNSQYFNYEGQFNNDQIVGIGKLYQQKSQTVIQEGEWKLISKTLNKQPQIAIKPRSKIKILQVTDLANETSGAPPPIRVFKSNSNTGFHDQLINQKDLDILKSRGWLNSSIIDSYIEHLNYKDEIHYWTLSKEDRATYRRLQINPSWLFSWIENGQNEDNSTYFKEIFSQFEPIKFRIWEIYKKIGFVINVSNTHWYFVQLDFDKMEILIKDSMRSGEYSYRKRVDILQNLFQQLDENIKFTVKVCQDCEQQRNGYDCGAYTCINAKNLAEDNSIKINNGTDMRNYLLDFILNTVKND